MVQSALQRYYNEHIHLPHAFFVQPERFIRQALKRKGDFFATAYNYVEPDSEGDSDFIEYSSADFTVKDFRWQGRPARMTARPIRRNAQTPDRNGKIFYTSTTSLSHISKITGHEAAYG